MDIQYILKVLFPYLVIFYLVDCVTYVKKHHFLFISSFGKRFRLKRAGFHLIGLFPLCEGINSQNLPLFITRCGLYILADRYVDEEGLYEAKDYHFIPYRDLRVVEVDAKVVKINGKSLIKTSSSALARRLAGHIQDLKGSHPSDRGEKIESFIAEGTDVQSFRTERTTYDGTISLLKISCSLLFASTFIILPLVLYTPHIQVNISFLLLFMALQYFSILFITFSVHEKIDRENRGERIYILLSLIFLPVAALHVISKLSRDIYSSYDYLTHGAVLLPEDEFHGLMRKEIRRIAFGKDRNFPEDMRELWGMKEDAYLRLIDRSGSTKEDILKAPEKQDRSAAKYCPLCGAEYRVGFNMCTDCTVDLKEF